MNFKLDSPSKLRNGEGVQFPAIIRFKSQLSASCFVKNEQKFKKIIAPTSLPFTELDILAPVPSDNNISFHIFDSAIYTPSTDITANDSARKKLQRDIGEACAKTGGFKASWTSLQYWGPIELIHYRVCTLLCSQSRLSSKKKCNAHDTTTGNDKPSLDYKLASTNNSKSLHSVPNGNSKKKRKSSKLMTKSYTYHYMVQM